jgi:RNA polymerase sigma factor (sigma-70 family)
MLILKDQNSSDAEKCAVGQEILDRYQGHLINFVSEYTKNRADSEQIVQETFIRGFEKYDLEKGGLKEHFFKSFLFIIAERLGLDYYRSAKARGAQVSLERQIGGSILISSSLTAQEKAILSEIRAEVRKCLRKISPPDQQRLFIWGSLLNLDLVDIEKLWPEKEYDNVRQMHSRAVKKFMKCWKSGPGPTLCDAIDTKLMGLNMVDPDRITDPENRKAYDAWLIAGDGGIPAAASDLDMPETEARKRVLDALEELMNVAVYRGSHSLQEIDFSKWSDEDGFLSDYLELGRAQGKEYKALPDEDKSLCDVLNRQLLIMRVSLGLAPMSDAAHTLGSLVHERVMDDGPGAFELWARELGLSKPRFRRFLGDDLEPSDKLLDQLSEKLDVDRETLRRMDTNRSETRVRLRAPASQQLSEEVRENILSRITK